MHLGTEKTNLETYFRNKIQLRNTIIKLETQTTYKTFTFQLSANVWKKE